MKVNKIQILKKILDLTTNDICSTMIRRKKISTDNIIQGPYVNLSGIIDQYLQTSYAENSRTKDTIMDIRREIKDRMDSTRKQQEKAIQRLKNAELEYKWNKIVGFCSIFFIITIIFLLFFFWKRCYLRRNEVRTNDMVHLKLRSDK